MSNISPAACLRPLTAFAFIVLISALAASAQTGLGVVRGTATDPSGAVLPKAEVTLTNTATGVTTKSQTSEVGAFYFGSVCPGPYTVDVTAPGFKKWTGTLQVEVGQTAVVDASMQ